MNNLFTPNNGQISYPDGARPSRGSGDGSRPEIPERNPRELFRILWRQKAILLGVLLVGMLASGIAALNSTPQYTAAAQVIIGVTENVAINIGAGGVSRPIDQERILSEVQIIKSKLLADAVIAKFELRKLPEFNAGLAPASWRSWLGFGTADKTALTDEQAAELESSRVSAAYQKKLAVSAIDRSWVIEVRFTASDPALAQKVVNSVVDLYIAGQLEAKAGSTGRATSWLNERLGILRQQVETSEKAVEAFRGESGLTQTRGGTLPAQQLAELSTQLVLARARRSEAESNLRHMESLMKTRETRAAVPQVLASPLIHVLREQEALVRGKQAELAEQYTVSHPRFLSSQAEIESIQAKIDNEVDRIIQGRRTEIAAAKTQEAFLESSVKGLEERTVTLNKAEVNLNALEREAAAGRTLYGTLLARAKELNEQDGMQSADARIVSYANLPTSSSSPVSPALLLITGFLGSMVMGTGAAAAVERFDSGFRSQEDVERVLAVPALGIVPAIPASESAVNKYLPSHPFSAYSEAIRAVSVGLGPRDSVLQRVILIASAVPGEGKTVFSISLAQHMARLGRKVILVDCDLRRPSIQTVMGFGAGRGLAEVLNDEATLREVIRKDPDSGALVLTAGKNPSGAIDLIGSTRFEELIAKLRILADIVIIDSAPLSAISDARVLSRVVDKTIFVVRWASTSCRTSTFALRQLLDVGADVSGVVLSRVDVAKHAMYGYGNSGYYGGSNRKYYQH